MKKKFIAGIVFFLTALFYITCVHYQEPNEVAIIWNRISGQSRLESNGGFKITPPWVAAAKIDIRPMRVCITSSSRSFNCKLIQFVPEVYEEFVQVEGFRYYWLSNRLSMNLGYSEEYRGMKDVLRGYAYSVKKYPFIKIIRDYEEEI